MKTSLFLVCLAAALAVALAFPDQGNTMRCTDNNRSVCRHSADVTWCTWCK